MNITTQEPDLAPIQTNKTEELVNLYLFIYIILTKILH